MSNTESAKQAYAEHAKLHWQASEEGDYETANRAHDGIVEAYRRLRAQGEAGMEALRDHMHHEHGSVRCWAATHCLVVSEKEAVPVLRAIANGTGLLAFSAETILSEWKKGSLEVPT